jgi:hypothetical protein
MKKFLAALFLFAWSGFALAQTSPNLIQGQVLTPAQWNQLFINKQDALGYTPLNSAGGTLTGRVISAAPGALTSGFNFSPGTTPGSPVNGDVWATSSGLFAQINGATIGPISGATSSSFAATAPLGVTFPSGVTTYALSVNATLSAGSSLGINLSNANTWAATQVFPNNSLTLAEFATLGANTVIGSIAGGTPAALTTTQLTTLCNPFTTTLSGCANAPTTVTGKFLRDDNTWANAGGTGTVTTVTAGTGITLSSGATCTTTCTENVDKATSANLEAGTSNKVLTADIIYDAEVTVTFSATQTLDFNTFLNARITATANTTSLTCSNIKASQSGVITWVQDGTGSRTMVAGWCSQFRWAGGSRGVLSTAINAIDALFYQCVSTTICYVSLSKAEAN